MGTGFGLQLRALDVGMDQRTWRAIRLQPMDILEVRQSRLRGPPPIPFALDDDHRSLRRIMLTADGIGAVTSIPLWGMNWIGSAGSGVILPFAWRLDDQTLPHGIQDDFSGVVEVQFLHQVFAVCLHSRQTQVQQIRHVLVRATFRK